MSKSNSDKQVIQKKPAEVSSFQQYQNLGYYSKLPHLQSCIEEVSRDEEEASEYYGKQ